MRLLLIESTLYNARVTGTRAGFEDAISQTSQMLGPRPPAIPLTRSERARAHNVRPGPTNC